MSKIKLDNSVCHIGYHNTENNKPSGFYLIDTKDLIWSFDYDPLNDAIDVCKCYTSVEDEVRKNAKPVLNASLIQKYAGKSGKANTIITLISATTHISTNEVAEALDYHPDIRKIALDIKNKVRGVYDYTFDKVYASVKEYTALFGDTERAMNYIIRVDRPWIHDDTRVDIRFDAEERKLPYFHNLCELAYQFYHEIGHGNIIEQACKEFPNKRDLDKAAYRLMELSEDQRRKEIEQYRRQEKEHRKRKD